MKCVFLLLVVAVGSGKELREGGLTLGWKISGKEDYSFSLLDQDQGFPLVLPGRVADF